MGCSSSKPNENANEKLVESVAIIGGGIAGLTTAYYLAKKGIKVCVYERGATVGGKTSYGPAAVTMWKGIKKPFDLDGTIDLTSAGLSDAIRYAEGAVWTALDSHPERIEMVANARQTYAQFLRDNKDASDIMNTDGLLYILDKKHFDSNKKKFSGDKSIDFYTKEEFEKNKALFNPLFDGAEYYGVIHSKDEGYVDPQRLVKYMARKVQEMGGKVKTGMAVERISEDEHGVEVVVAGTKEPKYSACIVALGAFPAKFVRASGFKDSVPEIYGVKGYSVTGRMPEGTLRRGVVDGTDTKFIRPFTDKNGNYCVRFGGITDPYDADDPLRIDWDRMREFAKNPLVNKMFQGNVYPSDVTHTDVEHDCAVEKGKVEVWCGIRPVNKHGRTPLVRFIKGSTKSMILSGFGANGFVMCWYAGPQVAEKFSAKQ